MKLKHTFCGYKNEVLSVALSDDYVVSASSDTTMRVYDARSYKLMRSIETHSKTIWDVTIVERTNIVISGCDDLVIALHTLPDGVRISKYEASMDISCIIDLGSPGRVAVSGCAPCQVKLFDIKELRKSKQNDNTTVVDLCSDDDLDSLFADEQIMTVDTGKTSMRKEQGHRVKPVQVDHVNEPEKGRNSLPEVKQEATKIDTREFAAALRFKALVTKTGCSKQTLRIDEATEELNKVLKTDGLKREIIADEFEEMFIQLSADIEVSEESWVKVYREVANREKRFESEYVALFDRFIKGRNKTRLLFAIRVLRHGCQDLKERGLMEDVPSLEENETLKLTGTFDKDGDGKLNRDEFVKAALSIIHGIQRDDAQNTNSQAT